MRAMGSLSSFAGEVRCGPPMEADRRRSFCKTNPIWGFVNFAERTHFGSGRLCEAKPILASGAYCGFVTHRFSKTSRNFSVACLENIPDSAAIPATPYGFIDMVEASPAPLINPARVTKYTTMARAAPMPGRRTYHQPH